MANMADISDEIKDEDEGEAEVVENPRTDQEIEDAYANNSFRVIYQSNNFFLPQIQSLINGQEVLNLRPEYQRRLRWQPKEKSLLIESLLLNIPIPPIFLYEGEMARYEVMDGQQRLNAVHEFLENSYRLIGLQKLSFLNGRDYKKLPPKLRRGLDRSSISAVVLLQETKADKADPFQVRRYVFERLNTGGRPLNAQEMRNSIYKSSFNDMIVKLARNAAFCRVFDIPEYTAVDENEYYENPQRQRNNLYRTMGDCQLVLRFFALQEDAHITGSMRNILDRCMKRNMDLDSERVDHLRAEFVRTIEACEKIFGEKAFKLPATSKSTERTSVALYDAIMVSMARRTGSTDSFITNAASIRTGIQNLIENNLPLLTGRANTSAAIKERLTEVGKILDKAI